MLLRCYWVILSIKLAPCEPKVISCGRSTQLFQEVKRSQKLRIFLAWNVLPLESIRVLCVCNGRKITSSYLKHHQCKLFWEREGFLHFYHFSILARSFFHDRQLSWGWSSWERAAGPGSLQRKWQQGCCGWCSSFGWLLSFQCCEACQILLRHLCEPE